MTATPFAPAPRIAILAAVSSNQVIGRNNTLPWYLPADLKHFKQLTLGHIIVMGRRTFDSIGKPLPGRTNVVLTRQQNPDLPAGIITARSIEEMLNHFSGDNRQIFIIGGAEIYRQALPFCQRLYLTEIKQNFEGDTFFPEYDHDDWQETSREIQHETGNSMEYHFVVLDRRQPVNTNAYPAGAS